MSTLLSTVLRLSLACTLAGSWSSLTYAQSSITYGQARVTNRAASAEQMVLLTYDVSDLLLNIPDHPYGESNGNSRAALPGGVGGGFGGAGGGFGGGGFFSVPNPQSGGMGGGYPGQMGGMGGYGSEAEGGYGGSGYGSGMETTGAGELGGNMSSVPVTIASLIKVIVNVVAPDSWTAVGGPGQIEPLGNSLVVRQSQAVHEQIQSLLDQFRTGSGRRRTVTIDARWLLLDSDDLEQLTGAGSDREEVDRQVLAEFTRRPSSMRGLTNCFTGQLVYIVSGTRQSVVTSVIPVVGSLWEPEDFGAGLVGADWPDMQRFIARPGVGQDGGAAMGSTSHRGVGYQPVVQTPNFGALLEIRPTLIPSDNTAIVDLRSTITIPGQSAIETPANAPATYVPQVDRLAIDTQQLATTLSVPLGKPVLVGGLTYVSPTSLAVSSRAPSDGSAAAESTREIPQLYLLLELRSRDPK